MLVSPDMEDGGIQVWGMSSPPGAVDGKEIKTKRANTSRKTEIPQVELAAVTTREKSASRGEPSGTRPVRFFGKVSRHARSIWTEPRRRDEGKAPGNRSQTQHREKHSYDRLLLFQ